MLFDDSQACRTRHVRCDERLPTCASCQKDGIDCIRTQNIRFKDTSRIGSDTPSFSETQVWVGIQRPLRYHDETLRVCQWYEDPESIDLIEDEPGMVMDGCAFPQHHDNTPGSNLSNEPLNHHVTPNSEIIQPMDSTIHDVVPDADGIKTNWHTTSGGGAIRPATRESGSQIGSHHSPDTTRSLSIYGMSPASLPVKSDPSPLTDREAILMRNYAENMALWTDIHDHGRHFETEVPRRALFHPTLRFAIFAFSSQHLNRQTQRPGTTCTEALEYYDKCLNLLIPAMSAPERHVTEEVHAAVGILRQYEEMEWDDPQLHLTGTRRIMNSMQDLDFTPGLREASAWLCLRQDTYISLVNQTPLETHLQPFLQSDCFRRSDDFAYAQRMVYHLAQVAACAFIESFATRTRRLEEAAKHIDEWYRERPSTFDPIRHVSRDLSSGRILPEIWMLLPCHVLGLQYYHIARIVLILSAPSGQKHGYEHLRETRKIETAIRNHLRYVIGLAKSNSKAENTLFTARHAIAAWGGVMRDREDREVVQQFLGHMQSTTGWNTTSLLASLHEQWNEEG
ncbi:hypothetical protein N0V93_000081 [Gnomoniopsis smithogilvyi]|uniref:Zn(2)-C6 fungal-type domain-containing protein n=1 Tax=Gnomoniopsis smithogilvyi TaxID=1191159 RepID=A0A9W9CZW4_9PEZI|nr:hypothetical protein N0V93_000081 [Gnomoniopsis smithogilvyi]